MRGEYPVKPGLVIGHEPVGVIEELGPGVTGYEVGDRVLVGAIALCGQCRACLSGHLSQCGHGDGYEALGDWRFGNTINGAQAEYLLVPSAQANLAKIPDGVTDEQALLLCDIASTGFSGAEAAPVRLGDTVVIFAHGPIGLGGTAGAKLMGASLIIGIDGDDTRLAMARRMCADVVLDYRAVDVLAEVNRLTGGGADVAIEALGTQQTFESALRCLRPGGTLSSLGVYSGIMLGGGESLESYSLRSASSVLAALAKRMPSIAHRKRDAEIVDVALAEIAVGDPLVIYPHEICPADGVVIEGDGTMDESYLTGEPFQITKTSGSTVISGAVNGESALTIRTTQLAADSRYAKIMEVMRESESKRPQLQRLGDQLGAIYTPVALAVAILAWVISGESIRFLAVLVIATPCPLLLAIPIAVIGSISLCARRAIIVKSSVVLEQIAGCRTAIFDKTGTLAYGEPKLTEQIIATGFDQKAVLTPVASLERYSKHPLSRAIIAAAQEAGIQLPEATKVGEQPGQGLRGTVAGHEVVVRRFMSGTASTTPRP